VISLPPQESILLPNTIIGNINRSHPSKANPKQILATNKTDKEGKNAAQCIDNHQKGYRFVFPNPK